jgi:hypothetical protein
MHSSWWLKPAKALNENRGCTKVLLGQGYRTARGADGDSWVRISGGLITVLVLGRESRITRKDCYSSISSTINDTWITRDSTRVSVARSQRLSAWSITTLYYTILHYTILHYTILRVYYTILHYTKLYYTILYYTLDLLYYTTLHYTILYYIILYYTIL